MNVGIGSQPEQLMNTGEAYRLSIKIMCKDLLFIIAELCDRFGMNRPMYVVIPRNCSSSVAFSVVESILMSSTFFGSGSTPFSS